VKDLIDRGILSIEHCSTKKMIADFLPSLFKEQDLKYSEISFSTKFNHLSDNTGACWETVCLRIIVQTEIMGEEEICMQKEFCLKRFKRKH
jgi:hypothetical protein